MHKQFAIRIEEETLPLIAKLNEGVRPDDSAIGSYFLTPAEDIEEHHNDIVEAQSFFNANPEANMELTFQTIR